MKKIIVLLLIVAFSALAFGGDFLNHPTVEYELWDDGDITLTSWMTGGFQSDPSTWGLENTYVSSDATNPFANVEPGALTNGSIQNEKGMLMKNTNFGGSSYEFYSFVYDDVDGHRLFVGVKAYDDVLHLAYQPYPVVKANRSDYAEFRLDFSNNAAQDGMAGASHMAGVEWSGQYGEATVNDGSQGYSQILDFFDGCTYEGTEYAAASGFDAWEATEDGDEYAGNAFGTHSLGFFVNAWWDLDYALTVIQGTEDPAIATHAAYGTTSYFTGWTDLDCFGIGLVIKDHDGEGLDYFDHDRVWSSGLHNTDGTTTHGHASDYAGSGRQSDVQCNTPAVFMSLVKEGRKLDVASSYATDFVTLDWDAPTGFAGQLTYNVYSSPIYDNTFNVHPDYYDNSTGVDATAERMYDWSGMWDSVNEEFYGDDLDGTYTAEWMNANPNAGGYAGNWDLETTVTGGTTEWTSGSMAAYDEYYFLVTVLDAEVEYPFPSDMIGFNKYDCVLTDATDMNLVALPFDMGFEMAGELGTSIGTGNVVTITKWDVATQGWTSASFITGYGWINDFEIAENDVLMLGVATGFEFVNIGKLLAHPSYDLTYTATTNMNFVTVPMLTEVFCDTAQELVELASRPFDGPQKSRVDKVSQWINTTQSWQDCYYAGSWLGTNFAIAKGMPVAMFPVNGTDLQWPVYDSHPDYDAALEFQPAEHLD
jgi:hypothetical protein